MTIETISPTHFLITIVGRGFRNNWFMFRVKGEAGKTVKVDIKGGRPINWSTLNPMYSDIPRLDQVDDFQSVPGKGYIPYWS